MEHKLMTEQEKADIMMESIKIQEAGNKEEAMKLRRTIPLSPHLAQIIKKQQGADFLIKYGYNLAEAEIEYGSGWLTT